MLKHMAKEVLEIYEKALLYRKKTRVTLPNNQDRSPHNNSTAANKTDDNLTDRHDKFTNTIKAEKTSIRPFRFLCNIRLVNQPVKIDLKIICTLEIDIAKLYR